MSLEKFKYWRYPIQWFKCKKSHDFFDILALHLYPPAQSVQAKHLSRGRTVRLKIIAFNKCFCRVRNNLNSFDSVLNGPALIVERRLPLPGCSTRFNDDDRCVCPPSPPPSLPLEISSTHTNTYGYRFVLSTITEQWNEIVLFSVFVYFRKRFLWIVVSLSLSLSLPLSSTNIAKNCCSEHKMNCTYCMMANF